MYERYARQAMLDQVGPKGQAKLARASAVVIGAGGLGSPALTYLAAAGVGRIGVVDADTVALSNLNRQFLHGDGDVGRPKAVSAKEALAAMNCEVELKAFEALLTGQNAEELLSGYDIVLGAVDSLETRFSINAACQELGVPYVDGGVNGFSGCVMFVHPPKTPCLRCVFPKARQTNAPVGVLGVTAGVVGTIEANAALLHLLGLPNPLENKLLMYDGLRMSMDLIDIRRDERCPVCGS